MGSWDTWMTDRVVWHSDHKVFLNGKDRLVLNG